MRIDDFQVFSINRYGQDIDDLRQSKYKSHLILKHKEIETYHREKLKDLHEHIGIEYNIRLLLRFGLAHILSLNRTKDISNGKTDKSVCSTRIAKIYSLAGLKVHPDYHYSQIEPHHFLNFFFEIVGYSPAQKDNINSILAGINKLNKSPA